MSQNNKIPTIKLSGGLFITLEGGEGVGKSTQADRLAERLSAMGYITTKTREPGGSAGAEEIRSLLVNGLPERWSANAETLLNYAARDSHLNETIRPALNNGHIVICDRFMDSTRAYQGAAGGVDAGLIKKLEQAIIGTTMPDLTLIFDLDPVLGLARTGSRDQIGEDRFESKPLAFHQTLRAAFLDLVKTDPQRCVLINADNDIDTVSELIWQAIEHHSKLDQITS